MHDHDFKVISINVTSVSLSLSLSLSLCYSRESLMHNITPGASAPGVILTDGGPKQKTIQQGKMEKHLYGTHWRQCWQMAYENNLVIPAQHTEPIVLKRFCKTIDLKDHIISS